MTAGMSPAVARSNIQRTAFASFVRAPVSDLAPRQAQISRPSIEAPEEPQKRVDSDQESGASSGESQHLIRRIKPPGTTINSVLLPIVCVPMGPAD